MTPSASASIASMPMSASVQAALLAWLTLEALRSGAVRARKDAVHSGTRPDRSINRHLGMMQDVATGNGFLT